jgi:head-tail adaptor
MSFGKMRSFINIVSQATTKDAEGFAQTQDTILASAHAYKEKRHGTEAWKNRATFSEATCLFRFRVIPSLTVTTSHIIICDSVRYRILSVEDVRDRHLYVEALASRIEPSMR